VKQEELKSLYAVPEDSLGTPPQKPVNSRVEVVGASRKTSNWIEEQGKIAVTIQHYSIFPRA
jgi:hypothetical protein